MAQRFPFCCHEQPMHLGGHILWIFGPKTPCMRIKFGTLRVKWTLGCQIYGFGVLSPTEIDYIVWDKEGLGESRRFFPKKTFSGMVLVE